MEPRPLRRPLDGGYTKTPILQIGNQVFCDSKAIVAELERRYPEPSLFPSTRNGQPSQTLAAGVTYLLDTSIFLAIPTQFNLDLLPKALLEDRAKMVGGQFNPAKQKALQPFLRVELQAQLDRLLQGWTPQQRPWILDTATPSDSDFSLYMVTFFMTMVIGDEWVAAQYPVLVDHFDRMQAYAQPDRVYDMPEITPEEALVVAKEQQSGPVDSTANTAVVKDGLVRIGQRVAVTPTDNGKTPATGELVALTGQRVTLRIHDDRTGDVYVHFPLTSYVITPIVSKL